MNYCISIKAIIRAFFYGSYKNIEELLFKIATLFQEFKCSVWKLQPKVVAKLILQSIYRQTNGSTSNVNVTLRRQRSKL